MFSYIYFVYLYIHIYYIIKIFLSGFHDFFTMNLGRKHNCCLSLEQLLRIYALKYCLGILGFSCDIITTQDDPWDISHKEFFEFS